MNSCGPRISVESTSSDLISKVKEHDAEAWSRLVNLYGPLVDFWVRRTGLQDADISDVFQDVFAAVAGGIERFRKERKGDSFRGWLRTIVRSKITDHFRRGNRQPVGAGGSDAHVWLHQMSAVDSGSDLDEANAIHQLRVRGLELIRGEFEERTWQMFWRCAVDEQPTREIAEEFGVSASAIRLAKSRVLRRLRDELGEFANSQDS